MIMFIIITILFVILGMYIIALMYEDRKFYNRVKRRNELIKRYTSED